MSFGVLDNSEALKESRPTEDGLMDGYTDNGVFYKREYAEMYLGDNDEIWEFRYEKNGSFLRNLAIKRPIVKVGRQKVAGKYYDLETPYGYGGFLSNSADADFINEALIRYRQVCMDNNIVAEFYRFNPFNSFPVVFGERFDFLANDRKTVYVSLEQDLDEVRRGFTSSLRRNLNKASRQGFQFRLLTKSADTIDRFLDLYTKTMRKKNAAESYYFQRGYFDALLKLDESNVYGLVLDGRIVNMVIAIESGEIVYYHLGASHPDYYSLNGNAWIFYKLIERYLRRYKVLYLGGGNSGDESDSLYRFKRKFSECTRDFYIAGNVYDRDGYTGLVDAWNRQNPVEDRKYFLKYRLPVK